jgi:hypothetical protein
MAQECAGPGGAQSFSRLAHAGWAQQPVDLRRADGQQFFLHRSGHRVPAFVMFEPCGQRGPEQFAAQLIALQPDDLEHRQEHERIISAFGAGPGASCERRQRPVQQAQGALAMITAGGAKLIEDACLVETTGPAVAAVDAGEGLPFGG